MAAPASMLAETTLLPIKTASIQHAVGVECEGASASRFTLLALNQIKQYDGDPRIADNFMKDDIKASIYARGLDAPLCVTRRPGESLYMPQAGGNTRLEILKELLQETGDERFRCIPVIIRPWVSETHTLTGHLAENALRGEMCFADVSAAVMSIKAHIEEDEGILSWKAFEQRLKQLGLKISHAQIARMRFMSQHLNDVLSEDVRIQYGPHHAQKLMYAVKGTDWLTAGKRDKLIDILTRNGMDIDESIKEITHRPDFSTSSEGLSSHAGINDSESFTEHETEHKKQCPATLLQYIIDLRRRNYRIVMEIATATGYFKKTDSGFGFRPSAAIGEESTPRMLAYLCNSDENAGQSALDIKAWYKMPVDEANAVLNIMKNIHTMMTAATDLEAINLHNIINFSNADLLHLQDVVAPESSSARRLLKEYIRHAATSTMIVSLFPFVSMAHIRAMRDDLNVENSGGRPVVAFPFDATRMWRLWKKYKDVEEIHRYLKIAKEVELPLGTVWNSIKSRMHPVDRKVADG